MNVTAVVIALLTLLAGVAVGWLARGQRAAGQSAGELEAARRSLDAVQVRVVEGERHAAHLSATLEAERRAAAQREADAARGERQLREAFSSLSADALAKNNEAFVRMAEQRLTTAKTEADGELSQRQQAIEGMVVPLKDALIRVQDQLHAVEKSRAGSYQELLTQVGTMRQTSEQLRTETAQLVTALRAPQVRGRWGEMQLQRAVEAAGMTEHLDFDTQETASNQDGPVRPDMIVHLVGGKNIVVDSKVAFAGYLEASEAKDDATRAARLRAHARHLRTHVDQLAAKSYWERFDPTPEFVVCFVPADAFLDAALREDPALLEHAFGRNVVLATPSTLVALLRTIAYTWRQEALAKNANEVHELGRDLYKRLATMGDHLDKLGRSLNSAVGSYNRTVSSLESRVLVTARRMQDLKVVEADLATPEQVLETARSTQSPELTTQRVVALPARGVPSQATLLDPSGTGD